MNRINSSDELNASKTDTTPVARLPCANYVKVSF